MARTFQAVWFLPDENTWRSMNMLAFRDTGTLIIRDDAIEYQGRKRCIQITNVSRISYGKQGRDFVNNW